MAEEFFGRESGRFAFAYGDVEGDKPFTRQARQKARWQLGGGGCVEGLGGIAFGGNREGVELAMLFPFQADALGGEGVVGGIGCGDGGAQPARKIRYGGKGCPGCGLGEGEMADAGGRGDVHGRAAVNFIIQAEP